MASYFRSWLSNVSPRPIEDTQSKAIAIPSILEVSPPPSDDDDLDPDDDTPPAFPSLSSAQRVASEIPHILKDSQLMPPPPAPHLASRQPGVPPSSSLTVPTTAKPSKRKGKVVLAPGHGALDWANLKSSGKDLRVGP